MSADEEFGRLVGGHLRDEVAGIQAAPNLAGALRRRETRRAWTVRASIGAPLIAGAAAAAVLVATAGAGPATTGGGVGAAQPPASTAQPRVENLAHVQDMTIQALRSAADHVIYEKETSDSGYYEYWTDRASQRYRMDAYSTLLPPGQGRGDTGDTASVPPRPDDMGTGPLRLTHSIAGEGTLGDMRYTQVDYERETWSTHHDTSEPPVLEVPDILDADSLKQAIDTGRMELVGPERVGDKDTHHLRLFATQRGYQIDLWVDSTSYLPVRETSAVLGDTSAPVLTSEYSWLPKNGENLAKLTLTPPPGFAKE